MAVKSPNADLSGHDAWISNEFADGQLPSISDEAVMPHQIDTPENANWTDDVPEVEIEATPTERDLTSELDQTGLALAGLSARLGRRLSTRSELYKKYETTRDNYIELFHESLLEKVAAQAEGLDDAELVKFSVSQAVLAARKVAEERQRIMQDSRLGKFINWYNQKPRWAKVALGVGVGATITSAGAVAGVAAGATAGLVMASRFARGAIGRQAGVLTADDSVNNFKKHLSGQNNRLTDAFRHGFDDDIKHNQSLNRSSIKWGLGSVAVGAGIGVVMGEIFDGSDVAHAASETSQPDPDVTLTDTHELAEPSEAAQAWDTTKELNESQASAAAEQYDAVQSAHAEIEPEEPELPVAESQPETAERVFEDYTDTVDRGDGFTHVLRDLAKAEGYDGLEPAQLYELYKENETSFSSFLETGGAYMMGSGDLGISNPGQLTISAELREQLVEGMREKLGLPPLVEIGDALTIDADDSLESGSDIDGADIELDDNVDSANEPDTSGSEAMEPDTDSDTDSAEPDDSAEIEEPVEIEWAADVDQEITEIDPGDNPWTSARGLAPGSQQQLFQQAIDIYAENNDLGAAEIKYPSVGSAYVIFDGVEWNSSMWPKINEILISLAETR